MSQSNSSNQTSSNNQNQLPVTVKAASQFLNVDSNPKKTAMVILGGISIGALLYKVYRSLPAAHESIPTAPQMHPLFGHVPFFKKNISHLHDALFQLTSKYEIVALNLPGFHMLSLNTPELCEWVFTTEFNKFFKGFSQNDKFKDLLGAYGQAIFVSDDSHWRFHRKIASRMFSVRNLRDFMYKCCIDSTKSTLNVIETLRVKQIDIDINDILGRMTFDCFSSIAFGKSFDSMSLYPEPHPFGQSFDALVDLFPLRLRDPLWKIKRTFNVDYEYEIRQHLKVIDRFTNELITKKRHDTKQLLTDESGVKTFDLFSLYYDHDPNISNKDMKFIVLNFIIAGRDTTRMLLSWFLYDLSQFGEVHNKVIAEIDAFNEQKEEISYAVITKEFKYLEAALCESLRYHPVVPRSVREAREDVVIPQHILKKPNGGNYVIKKGDRCMIHHYTICKLERFYQNAMKYDPMRFYEKGVRTFKQGIYPFFNQKPRLCLGRDFALMEAKIFVYHLLSKYSFDVIPDQEITYNPGIILNMKNGLKISLKKR